MLLPHQKYDHTHHAPPRTRHTGIEWYVWHFWSFSSCIGVKLKWYWSATQLTAGGAAFPPLFGLCSFSLSFWVVRLSRPPTVVWCCLCWGPSRWPAPILKTIKIMSISCRLHLHHATGSQPPEHEPCAHDAAAACSRISRTTCLRPNVLTGHKVHRHDKRHYTPSVEPQRIPSQPDSCDNQINSPHANDVLVTQSSSSGGGVRQQLFLSVRSLCSLIRSWFVLMLP